MYADLLEGTARPVTGFLLCYVPLATIILGLITLFVWTDRHASRPYLRFNPFVAPTATEQKLAARPPAVGETPAGPLSSTAATGETSVFLGEHGATTTVPEGMRFHRQLRPIGRPRLQARRQRMSRRIWARLRM